MTTTPPPDQVTPAPPGDATEKAVWAAVDAAAGMIGRELDVSDRDIDLLNLVVNATVHLFCHPGATLDEIIEANYSEDPKVVREWCEQ
jgi:hypothetical protein